MATRKKTAKKKSGRRTTRQRIREEIAPAFLEFTPQQFQLIEKGAELYEKKAATTATALAELGVPGLLLSSMRALCAAAVLALKNRDESEPLGPSLLSGRQKMALTSAMLYYEGELGKLIKKEFSLLAATDDTEEKIESLHDIRSLMGDQQDFFRPVEILAEKSADETTVSINGGEQIRLSDIDAVTAELKAAMERDLEAAEADEEEG